MVFIGHVDSGKSTICGKLMCLTGAVSEQMIKQYKALAIENGRDSWWLAYVMDSGERERETGKTVEVGRTFLETPNK
jgi:peptide chain release factor subunit 3